MKEWWLERNELLEDLKSGMYCALVVLVMGDTTAATTTIISTNDDTTSAITLLAVAYI